MVVKVTSKPGFTIGIPKKVPSGTIQLGVGLNIPRRLDLAPDGRFIGVMESEHTGATVAVDQINVVLSWFDELKQRVPTK